MSDFDRLADERWARGVAEIRGGEHVPFQGDPVSEGIEETLDLRNYANEAERQGRIPAAVAGLIRGAAAFAFNLLRKYEA